WRCEGWSGVISRTLRRSRDIYVAFLLLTLACAILVHLAGGGRLADESNTRILLDQPGATLAHAAILQYRSVNTDVLPIFVLLHLLFAPLLWLLLRVPNLTLGASLALYTLVHVFGWTVAAWPNSHWAFNPIAWQFLVMAILAAWLVPRNWRGLTTPVMRCAIRCGQNSLPIYCLGVLLAFISQMALLDISNGIAMQIALSVGGIAAMIAAAALLNLISVKPRRQTAIVLKT